MVSTEVLTGLAGPCALGVATNGRISSSKEALLSHSDLHCKLKTCSTFLNGHICWGSSFWNAAEAWRGGPDWESPNLPEVAHRMLSCS